MKLVELRVDGAVVPASDYSITDKGKLLLSSVPHKPFELETVVEIKPQVCSVPGPNTLNA